MPQPKGAIPWNKGRHGLQVAWSKGKKLPYLSGKKSFSWKGGRHIRTDGYVGIYSPNHPRAKSAQYILEPHLIMEKKIFLGKAAAISDRLDFLAFPLQPPHVQNLPGIF